MRSKAFFYSALFLLTLPGLIPVSVVGADLAEGEALHNEHCTKCHQAEIYERENRIVKNLQHLRTQVQFCEVSNDLTWFDEELDAVTEYLNVNYYLFELK